MFIIVGLGNPGLKYEGTRHNVGFDVIDKIAEEYHIAVDTRKHRALIGRGVIDGFRVILAKPQTFMNLSGESIRELVDYYKVDEETDLIVIYDDISLDVGQLRIRKKGSAGGHNGIKSIISHLGHDAFCGSRSESEKSQGATIWRIMCWDILKERTKRRWRKPTKRRYRP